MIDLIKELTESYGPSGREEEVQKVVLKHLEGHIDGHRFDPLGNLLVWKKGKSDKKVLLDAHIDEIGLVVTNIDDKGFLRIEPVGGVSPYTYVGHRVRFPKATGVVYYEGETPEEQKTNLTNRTFDHLFVDIGASAKGSGKFGPHRHLWRLRFLLSQKRQVSCFQIHGRQDRLCRFSRSLKNLKTQKHTVIGSFSVQEDRTCRSVSGRLRFSPSTLRRRRRYRSRQTSEGLKRHAWLWARGPAIKIKDRASISHRKVVEMLEQAAQNQAYLTKRKF